LIFWYAEGKEFFMLTFRSSIVIVFSILLAACATGPPFIDSMQPNAMNMAVRRGAFEMNCQDVKGELLSRETVEPISFRFGYERAEYTVGVTGCDKRFTYVVICPDNGSNSCFAGASRNDSMN
jgi:hypothetical protein